jgi:antitoxin (DNA-binding transcriptional repressor) of toxin-antitoxin stability system
MTQMDVRDASGMLPDLIERVRAGEEVVLTEAGFPVARLVLPEPVQKRRLIGLLKGKIEIAEDFDAPLPKDVMGDLED